MIPELAFFRDLVLAISTSACWLSGRRDPDRPVYAGTCQPDPPRLDPGGDRRGPADVRDRGRVPGHAAAPCPGGRHRGRAARGGRDRRDRGGDRPGPGLPPGPAGVLRCHDVPRQHHGRPQDALRPGGDGGASRRDRGGDVVGRRHLPAVALFTATYFAGGRLLPVLFAAIARLRSRELFLLTIVLVVIGTTVGLAALGLSPALGAYLAGVVVSRSHYSRQVLAELVPSRDLFASLFFVSVGMLVDPLLLWRNPGMLATVVGIIIFVRAVITASIVRGFGYAGATAIMTGLLLAHIGELSFVLAKLGADRGFISEELYGLVLGGALISILINPTLLRHVAPRLLRWLGGPVAKPPAMESRAETAGLAGHVVVCGCGRVGGELVTQLRARGLPYVVIELNPIRVEQLRRDGEPCLYGDANNLYILEAAGIGRAKLLAITHYDAASAAPTIKAVREAHPSVRIIARAHHPTDLEQLRSAGAAEVVMPEFEASMEFLRWTLGQLRVPAAEAEAVIQRRRADFRPSESVGEPAPPEAS
ncbi:MAG: cation:proton antiporter [Candidatus Rokubacteria bacterium]|nr:cation:proton antiporter [Candidatus Rokubacteria bacterium]